jgi:hypothetical protein
VVGVTFVEQTRAAFRAGDTDTVARLSTVELDRARAAGDVAAEVEALGMLARVAARHGELAELHRLALRAEEVARAGGEPRLLLTPAHLLAGWARLSGDLPAAREFYARSIALNESLGQPRMVVVEQHNLGHIELRAGEIDRARRCFTQAHRATVELGITDLLPYVTLDAAVLADHDGDQLRAAGLLGRAEGLLAAAGQVFDPDDALEQTALRERLVAALGVEVFERARDA